MGLKRVVLYPQSIAALDTLPGAHAYTKAVTEQLADTATQLAPARTTHYRSSISGRGMGYRHAIGRLQATDFKAHWIEFGAGPSPWRGGRPFIARMPMRRAVLVNGLRYRSWTT